MTYTINIGEIFTSQNASISSCKLLVDQYKKFPETKLIIDFNQCDFIYPDYIVLLLCTIKYLESIGFIVTGKIKINKDSNLAKYLAKMNFFENLQVQFPLDVEKVDDKNSVQIQRYTKENQIVVLNSILKVLRENSSMNDNVYTSLDYCLNEILDNVLNHSEQNEGWVVAQHFGQLNSIRLVVADYGIGIHNSLNLKHNFSEEEAMLKCIEEGVTNGKGQGHGLYATVTIPFLR
ncbi:MAG: hypothetical protein BGO88_12985 [Flavobacterium sp. 38-13]|uniref:ATP-binding protein n=1 Tax=Flavobacterium sp. 38-13 TaxID=1896168 RepID=UPI00095D0837|nr:ATP-binding protein [Flavobacterium sp. 38-13]OJX52733.1 MAG: hypothetical protein BGO88_12985 [Flavobacterium sp. 38-13]